MSKHERVKGFLERLVNGWEKIPIRVYQDDKWQSLYLDEVKDTRQVVLWIIRSLKDLAE